MREDGKPARLQHRLNHLASTAARHAVAVTLGPVVADLPEQGIDVTSRGRRIEEGQQMKATLHRNFDARKESQVAEAFRAVGSHLLVSCTARIDPGTAV